MAVDPISLSIGIAGILLAFKGVVDTINLFELIVSRDNGSRHLALKYEIERRKTVLWGDEHRAEDEYNSPLLKESKSTRTLIAGLLAELRAVHDLAAKYLDRYDMDQVTATGPNIDGSMALGGSAVTNMKVYRDAREQRSRFLWATSHKTKFTEIVLRMKSLNEDLYDLVRTDNTEALANALSSYLLPKLQNSLSLVALQQSDTTLDPLLVLSARIKQLQNDPLGEVAGRAKILTIGDDFTPEIIQSVNKRTFGSSKPNNDAGSMQPSWVEWKTIDSDNTNEKQLTLRIKALATVLAAPKPKEFRIPPYAGLLDSSESATPSPEGSGKHIGFVYRWPENSYDADMPMTLLDLIKSAESDMPLLDERFALAYSLASAISMFHATGWLHKAFRSDNILFFLKNGKPCITAPYITGFEYARPENQASLEIRPGQPELDLYYHPDVSFKGFNRIRDIYSLGVVLFEIARWAALSTDIPEAAGKPLEDMKPEEVRQEIENAIPALGAQMGSSYRDAVEACIKGDFGTATHDDDGEALARAFFARVLKRLSHCKL